MRLRGFGLDTEATWTTPVNRDKGSAIGGTETKGRLNGVDDGCDVGLVGLREGR
jgi:hypothetical protein